MLWFYFERRGGGVSLAAPAGTTMFEPGVFETGVFE